MKIATWNVNSINARLHAVTKWLKAANPDIVCLQETKTIDDAFPRDEIDALGYNIAIHGQKSYNGVAILSKRPFEEVITGLPGDDTDEQARYLEAVIMGDNGPIRIATIYLPNGNPVMEGDVFSQKYLYKLGWIARLKSRAHTLLAFEDPLILAGDYNFIPEAKDTHDPEAWWGDAAYRPETHAAFRSFLNLGLTEAFEMLDGRPEQYTFWDYQGGSWPRNKGIRIDHLVLSPQAADRIRGLVIDRDVRDGVKPSDHVPVIGTFDL